MSALLGPGMASGRSDRVVVDSDLGSEAGPYFWSWVDAFPFPGIIVARDGRVLWANPMAEELMSQDGVLTVAQGRLTPLDKAEAFRLQAFIAGCETPSLWTLAGSNSRPWVVRAQPIKPPGMNPAVGLMFFPAAIEARTLWADIEHLFCLTPAEAQVVKFILHGSPAEAVARELGVSVETVRTHIRRAYSKVGVTSREQLFAALSPFNVF